MYCPNCGEKLPDGSKFCRKCGTRLPAGGGQQEAGTDKNGSPIEKERKSSGKQRLLVGSAVFFIIVIVAVVLAVVSLHDDPETENVLAKKSAEVSGDETEDNAEAENDDIEMGSADPSVDDSSETIFEEDTSEEDSTADLYGDDISEEENAEDTSGNDILASSEDGASDVLNGAMIEEQEIYNDGSIIITADNLSYDGYYYVIVGLTIENNSEEDITVRIMAGCAVNGYSMNMSLYEKVSAGMSENGEIKIPLESLEEAGIDTITDIVFEPSIYTLNDDGSSNYIGEEKKVTITTTATDYVQTYDDSGEIMYEDEGIKVVYKGWDYDDSGDLRLIYYVENDLDRDISLFCDVSYTYTLDGADIRPDLDVAYVCAGNKTITHLRYSSWELEAEGITEPEAAVVNLTIGETSDNGSGLIVNVGPMTITF